MLICELHLEQGDLDVRCQAVVHHIQRMLRSFGLLEQRVATSEAKGLEKSTLFFLDYDVNFLLKHSIELGSFFVSALEEQPIP